MSFLIGKEEVGEYMTTFISYLNGLAFGICTGCFVLALSQNNFPLAVLLFFLGALNLAYYHMLSSK